MYGLSEESLTIVGVILIVVGVAMIGWGFEWNQDITNDKRVGTVVQRDMYSAFLLTHLDESLQDYDKEAIDKDFQRFMKLHNETEERLKNSHDWLPSSVGF